MANPKPPIAGDVVGFLVMTTDADPPPARWILRAHWSEHEPRCDLYLLDAPDPRYYFSHGPSCPH